MLLKPVLKVEAIAVLVFREVDDNIDALSDSHVYTFSFQRLGKKVAITCDECE